MFVQLRLQVHTTENLRVSEINILSMSRTAWLVWQLTALCCSTWSSNSKMVSFSSFTWFSAWTLASSWDVTWLLSSCSLLSAHSWTCWHFASTCVCADMWEYRLQGYNKEAVLAVSALIKQMHPSLLWLKLRWSFISLWHVLCDPLKDHNGLATWCHCSCLIY